MLTWRRGPRKSEEHDPAAGSKMLLGELMVRQGLITQKQLDQALEQQRKTFRFLGQILIEMDVITARDLTRMLELQHRLSQGSQEE